MSNKFGWIAAWTLDGARQRLRAAQGVASASQLSALPSRFSSLPAATIRLKGRSRVPSRAAASLSFVDNGPPEYAGLIFEATAFDFDTQDKAREWLHSDGPTGGKAWTEFAAGVNLIQLSSGIDQ
jgi:hypothetical protein